VLLSSHQMADVEELCNRVAIINRGRILYEGDVAGLKRSVGAFYRLRVADPDAAAAVAAELGIGEVTRQDGELRVGADEASIERLSVALGRAGIGVRALIPQEATLEELFFRLTEGGDGAAPAAAPEGDPVGAGAA
jgi:ABC-2 type transport system ATP-binding protein